MTEPWTFFEDGRPKNKNKMSSDIRSVAGRKSGQHTTAYRRPTGYRKKVRLKGAMPIMSVGGVLISLTVPHWVIEPICG